MSEILHNQSFQETASIFLKASKEMTPNSVIFLFRAFLFPYLVIMDYSRLWISYRSIFFLMLGKTEVKRRTGWQRTRWLDSISHPVDKKFGQTPGELGGQGSLVCCSPQETHGLSLQSTKSQTRLTTRLKTTQLNNNYLFRQSQRLSFEYNTTH